MNNQRLFDLSGKAALFIGPSRGFGDAITLACAQDGAKMELGSRKQADLDGVTECIREAGSEVLPLAAHACDSPARARVAEKAINTYDGIEIVENDVVTNRHFGPGLTVEDSYWDTILDVIVKGYFRIVKACVVLAAKLSQFYIQVNAIAFGLARTKSSPVLRKNPQINQAILNIILQRLMEDIAGVAIYLASPAPSIVTGSTFGIDGGQPVGTPIEL